jgi:DNA-binding response OmpR family regulator
MKILIIEDDKKIQAALAKTLKAEGYAVDCASDGLTGEEYAAVNMNDLIILDLMMPGQDGWTTCRKLRAAGMATPILMLTALGDAEEKVTGLDAGADDYLSKPFHTGELLARIRALTRRTQETRSVAIEKFGVRLDTSTHKVSREGRELQLSAKEFALLELFMRNAGRILTREAISEHLWDMNFEPRSNVIESFVKFLRRKIDKDFARPLIHTMRGTGYMFSDNGE